MISGIPLILGLGTRMSDPYVYVVFWALNLVYGQKQLRARELAKSGPRSALSEPHWCLVISIGMVDPQGTSNYSMLQGSGSKSHTHNGF